MYYERTLLCFSVNSIYQIRNTAVYLATDAFFALLSPTMGQGLRHYVRSLVCVTTLAQPLDMHDY